MAKKLYNYQGNPLTLQELAQHAESKRVWCEYKRGKNVLQYDLVMPGGRSYSITEMGWKGSSLAHLSDSSDDCSKLEYLTRKVENVLQGMPFGHRSEYVRAGWDTSKPKNRDYAKIAQALVAAGKLRGIPDFIFESANVE